MMKVFRRIFTLLLVIALLAAMPLSAFAASASRTVRYSGYDYVCYAQCGDTTAYASTDTDCSSSRVQVYAAAYRGAEFAQDLNSNYVYNTATVYFSSLTAHTKLYTEHRVSDVDGITLLYTQTVIC